jgi:hypothetical protein
LPKPTPEPPPRTAPITTEFNNEMPMHIDSDENQLILQADSRLFLQFHEKLGHLPLNNSASLPQKASSKKSLSSALSCVPLQRNPLEILVQKTTVTKKAIKQADPRYRPLKQEPLPFAS